MPLSNENVRPPTSEYVSLIDPPQSPTTSLGSTVGSSPEAKSQPSLPKVTDSETAVLDPHSKDMDITDALALKLRKKLLSEINLFAFRTFLLPASIAMIVSKGENEPGHYSCPSTPKLQTPLLMPNSTLVPPISEIKYTGSMRPDPPSGFVAVLPLWRAVIYGLEVSIDKHQRLEIFWGAPSDEEADAVWGLCEEIWMAMGMDSEKLQKLSKAEGVQSRVGSV
ncbi:hypothetical protein BDP27DRAFT_1357240 [Rhodocollybia butyracea]|uniref:Uncharacterized protein n=1 Tax=Rhodocollybia butyracea TaxID=206335 RepID=A0A9P5QAR7_9AGAR|nr:hypothetical protein BDP27DRAFT_1357240 [Rhodocollybia butyracea]